jgi:protein-S-isoprenylcysteine O-methyltransferase Ste14
VAFAITAAVLTALGAGIELWACRELGWRRALGLTTAPPDPALPRLVLRGPFGFVRHPQSLGLLLILAGAVLGLGGALMGAVALLGGGLVIALAVRQDRALGRR